MLNFSSDSFLKIKVSYICPVCTFRVKKDIYYHPTGNEKIIHDIAWWCNHPYCEARNKLQYKIKCIKNKKPKIKIELFTVNGKVYKKIFKLIN